MLMYRSDLMYVFVCAGYWSYKVNQITKLLAILCV
jgi:hypothetical protein